jgi:hypothetical protein
MDTLPPTLLQCCAPDCKEMIQDGKGSSCNLPGHAEQAALEIGNFGSGNPGEFDFQSRDPEATK